MKRLPFYHLAAAALLGLLTACGTKKTEETTAAPTAPAEAAPVAPAAPAAPVPAATFDLNSVPVTAVSLGSFPYLNKLPNYKLNVPSDSADFEFDRTYIYDGKNLVPVEGRVLRRYYVVADEQKKTSELMMQRNYENLVKSLGGVQVASGVLPSEPVEKLGRDEFNKHSGGMDPGHLVDTYIIRQKDREIWVQLIPGDYRYYLTVTERAAMPQRATATSAAELKKN